MWTKIIALWNRIPTPVRTWLKGLEVFVLTGTVSALMALPAADFSTTGGIAKFWGIVVAAAGGCVRLYLIQSPVPELIKQTVTASSVTAPSGATASTITASTETK
jgi:hypothetical protein